MIFPVRCSCGVSRSGKEVQANGEVEGSRETRPAGAKQQTPHGPSNDCQRARRQTESATSNSRPYEHSKAKEGKECEKPRDKKGLPHRVARSPRSHLAKVLGLIHAEERQANADRPPRPGGVQIPRPSPRGNQGNHCRENCELSVGSHGSLPHPLPVNLRGRAMPFDRSRGRTLSPSARGAKQTTPHRSSNDC